MGHVSDFNGMNSCGEAELNHGNSELMSADSILDLPLNENFMPIYNSFPEDIYRQSNLYASNNLSSFMSNDDDRNEYFDEPLELDLLFDSSFNIDFNTSADNLENNSSLEQNGTTSNFDGINIHEEDKNPPQFKQDIGLNSTSVQNFISNQPLSQSGLDFQDNRVNVSSNSNSYPSSETKTFTAETFFNDHKSCDEVKEQIPKLVIKLKSDSESADKTVFPAIASAPLTIADNVKLGRRRNGTFDCDKVERKKEKHSKKHKKHKKKSSRLKRHHTENVKDEVEQQNFSGKFSNCNSQSAISEIMESNQTTAAHRNSFNSDYQLSNNSNDENSSSPSHKNSFVSDNSHIFHSIKTEPLDDEILENLSNESLPVSRNEDYEFEKNDFASPVHIKEETDSSEDFLENVNNNSFDHQNIPDIKQSLQQNFDSIKSESESEKSSIETEKQDYDVSANEPSKFDLASDLIEELNAHHQQVFEEIEISTPDLELVVTDVKSCSANDLEASQQSPDSANDNIVSPTENLLENGEIVDSSINTLDNKISSCNVSHSVVTINSSFVKTKSMLDNNGSTSSKSSASHRSYRKRRRSSSSSSSCSDKDKFYNRPVKFDPVTQTYCDEFGREIRQSELKYYLKSKSVCHDSYNNGSSSSSRSKSPRYRSHHKKHRKPRSGSRSHKRRRHSSSRSRSRSRSRSHGRRYKDDYDRKYRSPSPKHRKRHYLDIEENMRAYEERRVMYVGDIPPDYTVEQLKERFGRFGPIQNASIKSKITADGSLYIFGFVTFKNRSDVCQAIERGNENPSWPRFDLNFGGRRRFCNGNYTDLDGKVAEAESGWYSHNSYRQQPPRVREEDDFAELLRQEQRRLGMTKK